MSESFVSILPPLIAIILAIKTRQIVLSLAAGVFLGYVFIIIDKPSAGFILSLYPKLGSIPVISWISAAIDSLFTSTYACIKVFENNGNTANIIFTAMVGSLVALMNKSGGTKGFVEYFSRKKFITSDRKLHLYTVFLGAIMFIEGNISSLVTGAVARPFYEKRGVNKTKLAFVLDSTSAPICVLIPLNAWWANIAQHIRNSGVSQWGMWHFLKTYIFNFYPIIIILLNIVLIVVMKDFFTMKKYQENNIDTSSSKMTDEVLSMPAKEGVKASASNLIIPVSIMILMLFAGLFLTGKGDVLSQEASGSKAVFWGVLFASVISAIIYRIKKILSLSEIMETFLKGLGGFISISIILVLSFAIAEVCTTLKTGVFFAKLMGNTHTVKALLPAAIFLISCLVAFSTGTSWGTWAIMIPIAVGLVGSLGANLYICIGAVVSGAIFGDHASPISDTTVISSAAAGCDVVDHVKTQLPYALFAGGVSFVLFAVFGFIV
jgi:Na+/H+ antiporter NhaC